MLNADSYYDNSQRTLDRQEFGKAGELLWGAIAETTKALHLKDYGRPISSHQEIREFLNSLSLMYRREGRKARKEIKEWKRAADNLHVNFYETFLDESTFMEEYVKGEKLLAFLKSRLIRPKRRSRVDPK